MTAYYKLSPDVRFLIPEINLPDNINCVDFFYNVKRTDENIFLGEISSKDYARADLSKHLIAHLRDRNFLKPFYPNIDVHPSEYHFSKCCWLADSILAGKMEDPVCVHYNPRIQENVVHPGQTRSYIAQLFSPEKIQCLYFNTSGVKLKVMKNFKVVEKHDFLKLRASHMLLSADHGSIIPHIYFSNQKNTLEHVSKYHNMIKERLRSLNFRIKSNLPIFPLEYWTTTDSTAPIEIYISDVKNTDDVIRACMLSILGRSYKSDTLEVKINSI
jgi:hypothetical protein